MRVAATLTHVDVEGDDGPVPGVCLTCTRCGHQVSAFGRNSRSVRYALAQLHRECPNSEDNRYYDAPPGPEEE